MSIQEQLQQEFNVAAWQVEQVISLIDDGNTIPFIARYRKEATGNLDDQVLRELAGRLQELRALEERRSDIVRLINAQGKMTDALQREIGQAKNLTELDDLYRPYRPHRRTRATVARERGLQPLADLLLTQPIGRAKLDSLAEELASASPELADADEAYAGAMDIIAEQLADDAWVRRRLRMFLFQEAVLESKGKSNEIAVFEPYYQFSEPVSRIAGHRVLAINRGEREKILSVRLVADAEQAVGLLRSKLVQRDSAAKPWLDKVAEDAWKRLLLPSLETEVRNELTVAAEEQAIKVFAENLRSLLMQPPIHGRRVLGLDPGYRTGCKLAVVDATGRVLDTGVIYPTPPQNRIEEARRLVAALVHKHQIDLVAIGNGTASREAELFISGLVRDEQLPLRYLMVSEAGASVYSASRLAADEFPEFDVSLRSAVSIARRLQDPLAELVKIEPKSIGVGQYQHDLNARKLDDSLQGVVEDCVNKVGVDLNTASPSLLGYIAGLSGTVAKNIVSWREQHGPFQSRASLMNVPKLGPKAFQQSAGFLRIPDAADPLDQTSVHPEAYAQVRQLSKLLKQPPSPLLAATARQRNTAELASQLGLGQIGRAHV